MNSIELLQTRSAGAQAPRTSLSNTTALIPPSRLVGEAEFAAVYAAADFAAEFDMWLDTSLTINWSLFGITTDTAVQAAFTSFTKCLRDWLTQRTNPVAFIYAHEAGRVIGLHSHVNVYLAGDRIRTEFRHWVRDWATRFAGRYIARAVRVNGPKKDTPWLHWLKLCYLCKGYDRDAIVQSGRVSPDGRDVRLGDLIPFAWVDPGHVTLRHRVGASRSLGPDRRAVGAPAGFSTVLDEQMRSAKLFAGFGLSGSTTSRPQKPFRSKYEDGARDVRVLYGRETVERITGLNIAAVAADVPFNEADDLEWLEHVVI